MPVTPLERISKVLVANRGEIAVRVMRACRDLGIPSVAVYADSDRTAMHVRYADEAYRIGGPRATESYLSVERLMEAVRRSGANAVHPGYGFLAENADFARAVTSAGAIWVGPPHEAIRVMGDKISSRSAAGAAGVAPVPGTDHPLSGPGEVISFADAHGWPVAIKAAFGGGGRGMRVVTSGDGVAEVLASAQREAEGAFGRPECYVEKYLTWPRHVEVQVFGDTHGNFVHLGTRDCSVQRRHQKLVEEAPAPDLPVGTAEAMGEAAVRVARACGYYNAGTIELIYQDGEFFFLEMNTRLQVEHPVTEMVTGLDLVVLQLQVADGQPLPFTQEEVTLRGHAMEARLNAEDPAGGRFVPAPGRVSRIQLPSGPWARVDAGYEAGDEISPHYDNLVAKVVAWGPDREAARRRLVRALTETQVEGVPTTLPAHLAILSHPDFVSVAHSTTWLTGRPDLFAAGPPPAFPGAATTPTSGPGVAPPGAAPRDIDVEVRGRAYKVRVWVPDDLLETRGRTAGAGTADGPATSGAGHLGGGPAKDGRARRQAVRKSPQATGTGAGGTGAGGTGVGRTGAGSTGARGAGAAEGGQVTVPMQGTIVRVLVAPGDLVEAGQVVAVLEAMKMENNIVAELAGRVQEVRAVPGSLVGTGDILVVFED